MTNELLDERAAAEFCKLDLTAFRNLRRPGKGPKFTRPSPRKAFYSVDDLEAWKTSLRISPIFREAYLTIHGMTDRTPGKVMRVVQVLFDELTIKEEEARANYDDYEDFLISNNPNLFPDNEFHEFLQYVWCLGNPIWQHTGWNDDYFGIDDGNYWLIYANQEYVAHCSKFPCEHPSKYEFGCESWEDYLGEDAWLEVKENRIVTADDLD